MIPTYLIPYQNQSGIRYPESQIVGADKDEKTLANHRSIVLNILVANIFCKKHAGGHLVVRRATTKLAPLRKIQSGTNLATNE